MKWQASSLNNYNSNVILKTNPTRIVLKWCSVNRLLWCCWWLKLTFIPRVEQTSSMMALSWLLWKYMATSNSISPKEAETPAALERIREGRRRGRRKSKIGGREEEEEKGGNGFFKKESMIFKHSYYTEDMNTRIPTPRVTVGLTSMITLTTNTHCCAPMDIYL